MATVNKLYDGLANMTAALKVGELQSGPEILVCKQLLSEFAHTFPDSTAGQKKRVDLVLRERPICVFLLLPKKTSDPRIFLGR